jgi:maleylpyruvate isomerase
MSGYRLYSYWRSGSSWRVRIGLALKGLAYEYRAVNLAQGGEQFSEGHLQRNAMGQVPVLEWTEGSEVRRLAQSLAILELLEERHPEPALLPRDRYLRAQARMLAEHVNSGIQPFNNQATLKHVKALVPEGDRAWAAYWIGRGLQGLERAAQPWAGRFLVGDAPTTADCCLVPQLYSARRFGVDLAPFPTLTRVEVACEALPAFAAAHPDRQPDSPPPSNPATPR